MRESLELVIIAITLLVAALVILTIFGTGITPIGIFSGQRNLCVSQFTSTCQSTGYQPSDWGLLKYANPAGSGKVSCANLVSPGVCSCDQQTHVATCT